MKTKKILISSSLLLALGVLYTGCKKTEIPKVEAVEVDTDVSTATDNSTADASFSGVFNAVNENSEAVNDRSGSCATITIDTSTTTITGYPKTLTVDYGTSGTCSGKKGRFTAVFSGPFKDAGSVITVTYQSYYDLTNAIAVTKHTITNNGIGSDGNYSFTDSIQGATITNATGSFTCNSTKKLTWTAGRGTATSADDEFTLSAETTGTSTKGISFKSVTTTPLAINHTCAYIASGVIKITNTVGGKEKVRTIDFGDGTCDAKATVEISGIKTEITLN